MFESMRTDNYHNYSIQYMGHLQIAATKIEAHNCQNKGVHLNLVGQCGCRLSLHPCRSHT